jgi:DNA-binding IscR family transcriptional regulator
MEGPLAPTSCLESETNDCPRADVCSTLSFWKGLNKVINDYVNSVTLGELAEEEIARVGDYVI